MYFIASFEHTTQLELVSSSLEDKGINKEDLCTIPLKSELGYSHVHNAIHRSDEFNLLDASSILGTILIVICVTYEYLLKWEGIIWGLMNFIITLSICFVLGFIISSKKKKQNKKATNRFLIIKCFKSEAKIVEKELYEHSALEVEIIK